MCLLVPYQQKKNRCPVPSAAPWDVAIGILRMFMTVLAMNWPLPHFHLSDLAQMDLFVRTDIPFGTLTAKESGKYSALPSSLSVQKGALGGEWDEIIHSIYH